MLLDDDTLDFPVLRIGVQPGTSAVIFHDVHFPVHDPRATDILVQVCQAFRPAHALANGDIFDYAPLSTHRRNALQALQYGSLAREGEVGRQVMQAIREAVPHCVYKRGNHEERLDRLVDDVPALEGLAWWDPIKEAVEGWDCLPGDPAIQLGRLMVFHGHEIGATLGQNPARRVLSRYPGQNTYFGHCHQIDCSTTPSSKNGRQVLHGAWTGGHLSDARKQHYAAAFRDRWQLGFSWVEFWELEEGQLPGFTVHPVRMFRGSDGRLTADLMARTFRA